MLEKSH